MVLIVLGAILNTDKDKLEAGTLLEYIPSALHRAWE